MPSSHLILWHPLLLLPSIFPSIRVSSYESTLLIRWSKNWSFSFSISPSNEYSRFISLKIDLFDQLFGYLHIKPNHLSSSHSSRCVWWRHINTFKTSDDLFKPRKMIFLPLKLKTEVFLAGQKRTLSHKVAIFTDSKNTNFWQLKDSHFSRFPAFKSM